MSKVSLAVVMACVIGVCVGNAFGGPGDITLVYQGAFRANAPWSGQTGLAFDPQGDSGNGSFFVQDAGGGPDLVEFTRATPIIGAPNPSALNQATNLQYIYNPGWQIGLGPEGLEVLPAFGTQTTRKLYGTHDNYIRCGYTETDGTDASGGGNPYSVSSPDGRMFGEGLSDVPADWVNDNLPSSAYRLLATGGTAYRYRGPSTLAFRPTQDSGDPEAPATTLSSVVLVHYSGTSNLAASGSAQWKSVAWVDNDADQAVLVGGYNWMDGAGTLVPIVLFYDPDELAQVAGGSLAADQPMPVLEFDMSPYFFNDADSVYGMDYDPDNNTLYVMEKWSASSARVIVHVFELPGPALAVPEPAGLSLVGLALLVIRKKRS